MKTLWHPAGVCASGHYTIFFLYQWNQLSILRGRLVVLKLLMMRIKSEEDCFCQDRILKVSVIIIIVGSFRSGGEQSRRIFCSLINCIFSLHSGCGELFSNQSHLNVGGETTVSSTLFFF